MPWRRGTRGYTTIHTLVHNSKGIELAAPSAWHPHPSSFPFLEPQNYDIHVRPCGLIFTLLRGLPWLTFRSTKLP